MRHRTLLGALLTLALFALSAAAAQACTDSWTGAGNDGLWTTAANWSTGTVPGASDDVCLPGTGASYTVTVAPLGATGTFAVHSLTIGESASEFVTLDIEGESYLSGGEPALGTELDVADGTTIAPEGLLKLDATSGGAAGVDGFSGGGATLGGDSTVTNEGEIQVQADALGENNQIEASVDNAAGSLVDLISGGLEFEQPETWVNDGTIDVRSGSFLDFEGSFTNAGTVEADGATSIANTGSVWTQEGTVSGSGVGVNGAALHDLSGAGQFTIDSQDNALTGTIPAGQTVTVIGADFDPGTATTLDLAGQTLTNDGTLVLTGTAFGGASGPATIVQDGSIVNNATLDVSGKTTPEPEIALRTPLVNAPGGEVDIASSLLDADQGTTFENQGSVAVERTGGLETTGGALSNDGTLANDGIVSMSGNGQPTTFSQSGVQSGNPVYLLEGATLDDLAPTGHFTFDGGADTLAGTISPGQTVTVEAAALSLSGQTVPDEGTLALDGTGLGAASLSDGALRDDGAFLSGATSAARTANLLSVPLQIDHGATATVASGTLAQVHGTTTTNDGTVTIAPGAIYSLGGGSTFTNAADGTLAPMIASPTSLGVLEVGAPSTLHEGGTLAPVFTATTPPAAGSEFVPIPATGTQVGAFARVAGGFRAVNAPRGGVAVIYGSTVRVDAVRAAGRRVAVTLTCSTGSTPCAHATVTVAAPFGRSRVAIARGAYALAPGSNRRVSPALNARGRALLAKHRRLRVTVTVTVAGAVVRTASVELRRG
ncbi:MAG TPA: hypothetical protein VHX88_21315 [Solirubrobacteraceae bacterium]|jgi:hypothetical protein|nr:hypothetical protein [Solirubrobacteraceae bacterium]